MEKEEIILISGIVVATIWLLFCILIEGKNRKYVIIAGIVLDVVLFIISQNYEMLLIGIVGGIVCGLVPWLGSTRKYETAVKEMNGKKNWVIVSIIFFVMILMVMTIAYPQLEVVFV